MVLSVEISGLLEERLRRLVDLGIYASVAEIVREAVRTLLKEMDLKKIALEMYIKKEASFQYITEFAEETYDTMIDYMLSKEVIPLIGAPKKEDAIPLYPGSYVLDSLTLYVVYKSNIVDLLSILRKKGYRFVILDNLSSSLDVLEAKRLLKGFKYSRAIEVVSRKIPKERKGLHSLNEIASLYYASEIKAKVLSDDLRTRELARRMGLEAFSSASVIATLYDELDHIKLNEYIYSYRSVPCILPQEIIDLWKKR